MDNEMMNYDEVMEPEVETTEVETEESGIRPGMVVLIGAGLTAAGIAAVKLGKKAFAKIKAKKEAKEAEEDDFVEVTDDEDVNEDE
jgi:hypothetical protein